MGMQGALNMGGGFVHNRNGRFGAKVGATAECSERPQARRAEGRHEGGRL
jgi:hypothetical protein